MKRIIVSSAIVAFAAASVAAGGRLSGSVR